MPIRLLVMPIAFLLLLVGPAGRATQHEDFDTLVVCHPSFRDELSRWIDYRQQQGHRVAVISPPDNPLALRQEIRKWARQVPLRHILLVGDASFAPTVVPTDYRRAKVNVLFGSTPEIATDHHFADLDDDSIPDLTIGRWTVRTDEQLRGIIDKVIAYETQDVQADWLRRINIVAGVGGFDPVIERSLEQLTRTFVTQLIPVDYETRMTYANWASPYCPDPHRFHEVALDRFNEGCLFWVYVGHGSPRHLDYVFTPTGRHHILSCDDVHKLQAEGRHPIALFLACHTGAFDEEQTCLAGDMMCQPGGPIAAICGTRVTMPYAMSLLSLELLAQYFHGDAETLGELLRRAKTGLVHRDPDGPLAETRAFIDAAAQVISPRADLLAEERLEHLYLFHLLGDPLLRLPRPQRVTLAVEGPIVAGQDLIVRGTAPGPGSLRVEVCYERGRLTFRPKVRREYDDSPQERQRYQREYEQALTSVCVAKETEVEDRDFEMVLPIPPSARGAAHVRAFWSSGKRFAVGSSDVEIQR